MTTQTQNETNHAQKNQDKAGHYDKALIALNVKYFQIVQGMTREQAQEKVNQIIKDKKASLMTAVECNQAISREKKAEARRAEEQAQEKFRKEQAEKAEREREEREAREAEAKAKKDKITNEEHVAFVAKMIAEGNSVVQVKGYLLFCGYTAKQIKAYLEALDLSTAKTRTVRDTFNTRLDTRLLEGTMSEEELTAFIGDDQNAIKNKAYHNKRREFANALHTKYNKQS